MIKLQDKLNTTAPNVQNPYGQIQDDDGTGNGTPVTKDVYQDHHIFFEKLMDEAEITPNGILDNAYDGFQLYQSFLKFIKPGTWNNIPLNVSGGASYIAGSRTPQYCVLKSGQVLLRGIISSGGSPPSGDHAISSASLGIPDQRRDFLVMNDAFANVTTFYVHTDGVLRADDSVFAWGGTAVLDGLSFWLNA